MSNVRSISAGFEHSLAIRQDGQAFAWGRNDQGQLGTGDVTPRLTPAPMLGAVNIKAVAAGWDHSLVLTAGGTVLAAGDNVMGELGNGTTDGDGSIPRSKLMPVKNATSIGSIAAWGFHSVMLKPYNVIYGTGLNNHGQVGLGHLRTQKKPTQTANLNSNNYIAVATGSSNGAHALALRADGIVVAWGANAFGQLGKGTFTDGLVPAAVKGPNGVGYLSNIIAIAAGDNHSLALAADGTVWAWGDNTHGQLGIGNFTSPQPYPVHVVSRSNVFAIAAGAQHSLLLSNLGQISAAGLNDHHQLGTGTGTSGTGDSAVFVYCGPPYQIAVAGGASHSVSLDGTGGIYAWGRGDAGQLGYLNGFEIPYPIYQPGTAAIAVAAGGDHSLVLDGADVLWGTGSNFYGELGLDDTVLRYAWGDNINETLYSSIASGLNHSLFLETFGNLYASGLNANGQLGIDTTVNQIFPSFVMNGVLGMAGGAAHTLILTSPSIQVASVTLSPASVKGGTSATGTVTLNGVAGPGGQRVTLWVVTEGEYVDCATVPAYVDVMAGSKTATFPITTKQTTEKVMVSIDAWLNTNTAEAPFTILP